MSRRSNVLGGVGVEVSPSAASTINNIVTIQNNKGEPTYPQMVEGVPVMANPYMERSLETAEQRKQAIESVVLEKNLINAQSIIIDVIYENPLMINKLIVTDAKTLTALIKLLTNSDSVAIQCEDPECSCLTNHLLKITSIHITKGTVTTEFKYNYQDAKRLLEEHHISIKYVRV